MSWRLASSLVKLRQQVDAVYPTRNRVSDGAIGDTAHASRSSDHNPNAAGVVCALDITNDPSVGFDVHAVAEKLRVNRHPDLKYIISNSRIAGAWTNWEWTNYTGSNKHIAHAHFSVGKGNDGQSVPPYDDTNDWQITTPTAPTPTRKSNEKIAVEVKTGAWGNQPERQRRLEVAGYNYQAIQNIVNGSSQAPARLNNDQVADQVIANQWGVNPQRRERIQAAGYDYNAIQAIVNRKVGARTPQLPARKSNDQIANEVIAAQWGVQPDRERRIRAAGYDYQAIRAIVNRKLR